MTSRVGVYAVSVLLLALYALLGGCEKTTSQPDQSDVVTATNNTAGTGASPSVQVSPPPAVTQLNPSPVSTTNSSDACLPFPMPTTDVLFSSPKKVFAHYFYPFPLAINQPAGAQDYYNTQYLTPTGESDKYLEQGGYLRSRPLPVPVSTATNWQQLNMQREVQMAISRGITGFTFDVLSFADAISPTGHLQTLLAAAAAVDTRFKIVPMIDISSLGDTASAHPLTVAEAVQIIASVAEKPAVYRLADDRLVVSAFDANLNPVSWWSSVISQLNAQGINVAFVPVFLGEPAGAGTFSPISYGVGGWGTATPGASSAMQADPAIAHNEGLIYMLPVNPQQYRPDDSMFWEASNSVAFRNAWMSAILGDSDWVQLVTWSDFSESGQISPYTDATLSPSIGSGFYDLNAYFAAWFLTGTQPSITQDVLYYFYRREASTADHPAQSLPLSVVTAGGGPEEDNIELLAFLTAPGVLKITIGGQSYTQDAPAGITSFKVPLQPGSPVFTLSRSEADVFSFKGGIETYGHAGIPSGVLDMTYWSGSATKSGICTL